MLFLLNYTDISEVHTTEDLFGELREYDLSDLLDESGIVAYEVCKWASLRLFILFWEIKLWCFSDLDYGA